MTTKIIILVFIAILAKQACLALQCYKCEEKTNGVTNSCHINDNSYGTTEMCSTQESACFKETKKNSDGVTVYQRGCSKPPINSNTPSCEPMEDQNGYTNLQKCYCFENQCNGSTTITMTSLSMGLFGLLIIFREVLF